MRCLNCGLCCIQFDVVIVNPKYASEGIVFEELPEYGLIIKPGNSPCPHLYWEGDESRCMVHNYTWYKRTPCYDFSQIESSPKDFCRLGEYSIKTDGHDYWRKYCSRLNDCLSAEEFTRKVNKDIKNVKTKFILQPEELRQMSGRIRQG